MCNREMDRESRDRERENRERSEGEMDREGSNRNMDLERDVLGCQWPGLRLALQPFPLLSSFFSFSSLLQILRFCNLSETPDIETFLILSFHLPKVRLIYMERLDL